MTGAQMLAYVKRTFKRTDKDQEIYDAIRDTVMDIRVRFKAEDYKEEAYSDITVVGDFKISLPEDFAHLIGRPILKNTSDDSTYPPLRQISKERYDELYYDRISSTVSNRLTGTPVHFCLYGREIFVGPAVDKTTYRVQLNYTTEDAEEITASTAVVPFSNRHCKTLRYGAMKELYIGLENYQEAEAWSNLYEADIPKIINNDLDNIADSEPISYNGI